MDDEYLRRYEHQEFARGVDREQVRQNKRIADLRSNRKTDQRSHIVRTKTCNQYGEHAR